MHVDTLIRKYIKDKKTRDAFIQEALEKDLILLDEPPLFLDHITLNGTHCTICGKTLSALDIYGGYNFSKTIGYGSKFDLSYFHCNLCADCFDKVIETILPLFKREIPLNRYFIANSIPKTTKEKKEKENKEFQDWIKEKYLNK